jgi:hypothetical protein
MENNQKLHIALAAIIGLIVIIGLILVGTVITDNSSKITSNQLMVISNTAPKTTTETTYPKTTNTQVPCEKLGQTLKEQKTCYRESSNCNSVEVNIHNSGYNYNNPYRHYYKPHRAIDYPYNKYYNNQYPYYKHGFYYSDSHGIWKSYKYY